MNIADEGGDKVQRFKKWFWSIIEKMSPSERQDLVGGLNSPCVEKFYTLLLLIVTLMFNQNKMRTYRNKCQSVIKSLVVSPQVIFLS